MFYRQLGIMPLHILSALRTVGHASTMSPPGDQMPTFARLAELATPAPGLTHSDDFVLRDQESAVSRSSRPQGSPGFHPVLTFNG